MTDTSAVPRSSMTRWATLFFAVAGGTAVGNLYWAQPLLDTIAGSFGVTSDAAGLLITATQVGYAIGVFFLVPLGDIVNRKRVIPALMVLSAIFLAATAVAPGFSILLVTLALLGVSTVSGQFLMPLAGDLASDDQRGRVLGTIASGLILGILVARTNPELPKHQGLTYFVIDMDQPGIEIRPIREMTGRSIFNEVFLTDAVVPEENRLDEVGSGWGVALTTLANERTMLGAGSFGSSGGSMAITKPDLSGRVGDLMRESGSGDGVPSGGVGALLRGLVEQYERSDDPLIRQEYATIYSLLEIARFTDLRVKGAVERGGRPGPEVSVGKLAASHLLRTLRETMFRICGADATLWGDDAPLGGRMHDIGFSSYLISIGGGTDQIQRNIIGERVLGLPREPSIDKGVAFSELLVGTQRKTDG